MLERIGENGLLVLALLLEHGETPGVELVKKSGGKLGRGTMYVLLDRLEDEGVLTSRYVDEPPLCPDGPRRRQYKITDHGRGVLALSRRSHG